jgi:hypothetical protein
MASPSTRPPGGGLLLQRTSKAVSSSSTVRTLRLQGTRQHLACACAARFASSFRCVAVHAAGLSRTQTGDFMRQHDVRHTALASRAARVTHTRAACRRRWNKGGLPLEDGTCVLLVLGSSLETELAAGAADGRVKDAVFDEAAHSGIQARQVARRPRPLPASPPRAHRARMQCAC